MRRILIVLGLVALALLAAFWLRRALASDAQRIRWRIESMAAGFDDTRLAPCARGLSEDYLDEESGTDRDLLLDVLRSIFLREIDPETKRFRYRVEVPPDRLIVSLDPEQRDAARVELVVRFLELVRGGGEELSWEVLVEGELVRGDRGWQFRRTLHRTLDGSRL